MTPKAAAALGFVVGAVLGWMFFHQPGDGALGTVVSVGLLAVAFAAIGFFLVRPLTRRDRR